MSGDDEDMLSLRLPRSIGGSSSFERSGSNVVSEQLRTYAKPIGRFALFRILRLKGASVED